MRWGVHFESPLPLAPGLLRKLYALFRLAREEGAVDELGLGRVELGREVLRRVGGEHAHVVRLLDEARHGAREAAARLKRYECRNITYVDSEYPIFWERGEGANIWDADGNRYLDCTSAFGVTGLGHTHPAVRKALVEQSARLFHAMGDVHPTALKADLCARLSALTFERWGMGIGKTILGNSGFEAVEAALKTALLHTGKPGVIVFEGAYHGLGYGTLEVGAIPYFREPFRRQLPGFAVTVPYPRCLHCPVKDSVGSGSSNNVGSGLFPHCSTECLNGLRQSIETALAGHEIGAILVEPMQGRGGEIVPPLNFLRMLRAVCDQRNVLLILDEIYTGFNRTGRLFACEHSGVIPDLICLGKGLTSGFPLSACVGRADVMDAWPESAGESLHTSTFLGNPLGCAMALASLEEHAKPGLADRVAERGTRLRQALAQIRSPHLADVRGVGMLIGMEFKLTGAEVNQIVKRALRDGLILLQSGPEGNVLAFTPPFVLTDAEIDWIAARMAGYLAELQ